MSTQQEVFCTERDCRIGSQTIRGRLYRSAQSGSMPMIICSHGFGSTSARVEPYAKALAQCGAAAYTFDFRGGGRESRSDGVTTDMSVMTEAVDLEAVLADAAAWPEVDPARIVLLGASQGGYVSAVVAARRPEQVAALVLLYTAFVAGDDMHRAFQTTAEIPDTLLYRGLPVGRRYFTDLWDYDPYEEIGRYDGPVLIVHGTADAIVPVTYSERARTVYRDATLKLIPGGGHGFSDADRGKAIRDITDFLRRAGILPEGEA